MTKFIDNKKNSKNKVTVFEKLITSKGEAVAHGIPRPTDFEVVEFIGCDLKYGDVFKAHRHSDRPNDFTILFGKKGDEFK